MNYSSFLGELEKAGLSVRAFAELVGMNPNSISNYARAGGVPTHLALISVLIGEMAINGLSYRSAIAKVKATPKRPRGGAKRGRFGGDRQITLLDLPEGE